MNSRGNPELVAGQSLLLPEDRAFHPDVEGLEWRITEFLDVIYQSKRRQEWFRDFHSDPMYLLDSNVLKEAKNRCYAFGICPGFWDWLRLGSENAVLVKARIGQKTFREVILIIYQNSCCLTHKPDQLIAAAMDEPLDPAAVFACAKSLYDACFERKEINRSKA